MEQINFSEPENTPLEVIQQRDYIAYQRVLDVAVGEGRMSILDAEIALEEYMKIRDACGPVANLE